MHGLLTLASPALPGSRSIATGSTRRFLDLEHVLSDEADLRTVAELDRLNVTWQRPAFRLVVGRQAVTWGVNFFWPVLDLFAPFPPERIDREYKPGVDAARLTIPLGTLSELDVVGAGQGKRLEDDGSAGALARVHAGPADLALMAGWFHGDVVVGGFVTADAAGTGVRGEVTFTDSGDSADAEIGRRSFWRATIGVDRQITPTLGAMAELAWNGFGADDPDRYPRIAAADRVRRGEAPSLGRVYTGGSLAWQAHPLVTVTAAALVNASDGSVLLLPHVDWSLTDTLSLELGLVLGIGPGLRPDGMPGSEYGTAAETVFAAVKAYF